MVVFYSKTQHQSVRPSFKCPMTEKELK